MPMILNEEQLRAVDAATDAPARLAWPQGEITVLLPADDFTWLRQTVPELPDLPCATDPRSQRGFVLVPLPTYERFKAFFEDDPFTPEERRRQLHEFGLRAGWDDPALDVYEEDRSRP